MVEIRTDELHMKSVSISEFQKHRINEIQTLRKGPQNILPAFSTQFIRFRNNSVLEASTDIYWLIVGFMKIGAMKAILYSRV